MHVFNWFPFPNDVSDYRVSLRHQKNHRDSEYEIFRQLCLSREHIFQPSPTKTLLPLSGYPSSVLVVWWQQQSPPQPSVRVTVRWSVRQMAAQSPPVPRPGHTTTSSGQFLPVSWSQLLSHRHRHRATDRSPAELSPVDSRQG